MIMKPISEARLFVLVAGILIVAFFVLLTIDGTPDATESFRRGIKYAADMCQAKGQFSPDGKTMYYCEIAGDE